MTSEEFASTVKPITSDSDKKLFREAIKKEFRKKLPEIFGEDWVFVMSNQKNNYKCKLVNKLDHHFEDDEIFATNLLVDDDWNDLDDYADAIIEDYNEYLPKEIELKRNLDVNTI